MYKFFPNVDLNSTLFFCNSFKPEESGKFRINLGRNCYVSENYQAIIFNGWYMKYNKFIIYVKF